PSIRPPPLVGGLMSSPGQVLLAVGPRARHRRDPERALRPRGSSGAPALAAGHSVTAPHSAPPWRAGGAARFSTVGERADGERSPVIRLSLCGRRLAPTARRRAVAAKARH